MCCPAGVYKRWRLLFIGDLKKKKIDARGKLIKPGRSGLRSSVLWIWAIDRIWSISAIRLYDSEESLHSTVPVRVLRLFLPAIVKISKRAVSKVPEVVFPSHTHSIFLHSAADAQLSTRANHWAPSGTHRNRVLLPPQPWGELPVLRNGMELSWDAEEGARTRGKQIWPLITLPSLKVSSFRGGGHHVIKVWTTAISYSQKRAMCRHQAG